MSVSLIRTQRAAVARRKLRYQLSHPYSKLFSSLSGSVCVSTNRREWKGKGMCRFRGQSYCMLVTVALVPHIKIISKIKNLFEYRYTLRVHNSQIVSWHKPATSWNGNDKRWFSLYARDWNLFLAILANSSKSRRWSVKKKIHHM